MLIKANAEERAKAVLEVFEQKLIKRGISLRSLDAGEPFASRQGVPHRGSVKQGIAQEDAKKINKIIRDEAPKGVKSPDPGRRAAGAVQEPRRPAADHGRCSRATTSMSTSSSSTTGSAVTPRHDTGGTDDRRLARAGHRGRRSAGRHRRSGCSRVIFVPRNRKPQTAMAWLLAIFLIPYVGFILFLLLGSTQAAEAAARQAGRDQRVHPRDHRGHGPGGAGRHRGPPWLEPIVELNRTLGSMPLVGGNTAKLYTGLRGSLDAMTAADRPRRRSSCTSSSTSSPSTDTTAPFFDALEAAVKRGVTVRVLLDHLASLRSPGYRRTIRKLNADRRALAPHAARAAAARQVPAPRPAQPPQAARHRRRWSRSPARRT